jgi:hypothetical protein
MKRRHSNPLIIILTGIALLGAGCGNGPTAAPTAAKPSDGSQSDGAPTGNAPTKNAPAPISKTCTIPPPAFSSTTSTNAVGAETRFSPTHISTSEAAIPKLWEKALEWASDARLTNGYNGEGNYLMLNGDPKARTHYGEERGAVWAWSADFYSPSKKQRINVGFIDGETGGSLPSDVAADLLKSYEQYPSLYTDVSDMISSCQAYEVAKANGLDDKADYYIIMTGDNRSTKKYPGRKTWVLEERSRTDNDNGKEPMGKIVMTYLIDGVTGEFLEKRPDGKVYSF